MNNHATSPLSSLSSGTLQSRPSRFTANWAQLRSRFAANRFLKNVVSNAGGNALNAVLQLGLLLLLSRFLSSATYAAWLTATSVILIGECVSDFGTRLWAVSSFAGNANPTATLRQCLWNKLFYTFCGTLVLSLLPLNTLSLFQLLLAIAVASTQPSTDPLFWYLRGRDRLDIEAGITFAARVCQAAALLVAGWMAADLEWLLAFWLCVNICRMTVTARLAICQPLKTAFARGQRFEFALIRRGIATVFPIGVSMVLAPFFTQAALLTLSILGNDHDVNVFGTALKLVIAAGFVGTSVVVSSYPRLSEALLNNESDLAQSLVDRMCRLLVQVMLPICLLGIVLAVPAASILLPVNLHDVGLAMVLLIPGLYLSCVNMAAKYTLNAAGKNWLDVVSLVVGFASFGIIYGALTFLNDSSSLNAVTVATLCWIGSEFMALVCRIVLMGTASSSTAATVRFPVRITMLAIAALILLSTTVSSWYQGLLTGEIFGALFS